MPLPDEPGRLATMAAEELDYLVRNGDTLGPDGMRRLAAILRRCADAIGGARDRPAPKSPPVRDWSHVDPDRAAFGGVYGQ